MSYLSSLNPKNTPQSMEGRGDFSIFREQLLQYFLLSTSGGFILSLLIILPFSVINNKWLIFIIGSILTGPLFLATLNRGLSYKLRSNILLVVLFLSGNLFLIFQGISGIGFAFFVFLFVLSVVLLRLASGVWFFVLSLISSSIIANLYIAGSLNPPTANSSEVLLLGHWIQSMVPFLLLGVITLVGSNLFVQGLEKSIQSQIQLSRELNRERDLLSVRIDDRTRELEGSLNRLQISAEIAHFIVSTLDIDSLLQQVVELLQVRFHLYYVGIFLMDDAGEYAVLHAGTGEAGQKLLTQNHRLIRGGSSMIGRAVAQNEPRITQETMFENIWFKNPVLPLTRSEMALPLSSHGKVFGALTIQSEEVNAFSDKDIELLKGVADTLSIALEITRLKEENQNNRDEIQSLNRTYLEQAWKNTLELHPDLSAEFESSLKMEGQDVHQVEVPLLLRGQEIGAIQMDLKGHAPSPEQLQLAEAIALQTALALDNARLLEETHNQAVQEQKINEIAAAISTASSLDQILKTTASEIGNLPSIAEVTIHLVTHDSPESLDQSRVFHIHDGQN